MQRKHQMLAAWIFGSLTLVFLMVIYLRGGNTHDPVIRLIASILAGLMGFFITGSMKLVSEGKIASWGKISIQAGGGAAFFALVFLTWPKEPVVNPKEVGEDAAVAAVRELLSDPSKLNQLIKQAAKGRSVDDPAIQELIALKQRLENAAGHLEQYAATTPLPPDIRDQLNFAQETLGKLRSSLFKQFSMELRMLMQDGTSLGSTVEETGLPPVEHLQLRLLLPKARLKEELPKGFWDWSPELLASWVGEASDFVSLIALRDVSKVGAQDIMCFEKPRAESTRLNAVHFDGSVRSYPKDELIRLVKDQAKTWRPAWEKKINFDAKSEK